MEKEIASKNAILTPYSVVQIFCLPLQAGIPADVLLLALEPEAAAIYCKELAVRRAQGVGGAFLKAFDPGEKYVVLDLGGKVCLSFLSV